MPARRRRRSGEDRNPHRAGLLPAEQTQRPSSRRAVAAAPANLSQ
ncbi:hypothetical protein XCR_3378 [Xanthomonas campestris pv. raphani 756C]|nr:hypothetical protein XCR_3378 [Xanthomonas campestris pv. raphani 756C]